MEICLTKNGQKWPKKGHFPHFGLYKCHHIGHVGCLGIQTHGVDQIQEQLGQLEVWVKNMAILLKQKIVKMVIFPIVAHINVIT